MSSKGALIVIGSGPGIGSATAAYFAEKGFEHVILLSRNQARLAKDAQTVNSAGGRSKVDTVPIDLAADEATVKNTLSEVDGKLKAAGVPLEVVLFNAARVGPSKLLEFEAKGLEEDLKISTINLYVILQWAIPKLLDTAKAGSYNPAFLTTSGGLYREPAPVLFSLSVAKAAQHNLMYSIYKKFEPQIHCACLPISGVVTEQAKVTTPQAVAAAFWKLYQQPKGTKGKFSNDLEDPDYEAGLDGFRKMVEGA